MRIAIDIREACKERRTGKGQWTHGFTKELLLRGFHVIAYTDRPVPPSLHADVGGVQVRTPRWRGWLWHWAVARHVRRFSGADLYVSPTSYIVPALLGGRFPVLPVIHDLIAFRNEPHEARARRIERFTLGRAVRSARHILTVSGATKQDLLKRFPSQSPQGVTPVFAGPMQDAVPANVPDGRTILCAGTLSPRKNQLRLIRAYARLDPGLRKRFSLVLTGARGWQDNEIIASARDTPGVVWKDFVDEAEYGRLLSTCVVFALPSLYEGFGLQILDALQRGIPILTSRRGSLPEVCGNAAHYVDPEDIGSIAAGLDLLLREERVRADLRDRALSQAASFNWKRTVDLFLGAVGGVC
ncbi:MAG: glycosyltransferase family 1 protein [Candidatus Peribacteraceae bacterium]|nr:glycosyltransferase family 1 protein [Candidatus Peribacteraceae bacterium]